MEQLKKNFDQLNKEYGVEDIFSYTLDCAVNGNKISALYHEMDYDTKQDFIDYLFEMYDDCYSDIKRAIIKIVKEIAR